MHVKPKLEKIDQTDNKETESEVSLVSVWSTLCNFGFTCTYVIMARGQKFIQKNNDLF